MNIGRAIKLCRTQRGLSQTALAREAKCSTAYLSMLENNKRDPTISTLRDLAQSLGVPIAILFFLGAEGSDMDGLDNHLQGELARNALHMLNQASSGQTLLL